MSVPPSGPEPVEVPGHDDLLRDLQLHQQELESQNVELRRTQQELAAALDRYRDLYDRAPVGYFTLDADGVITGANLTAALLLATAREALIGRALSSFLLPQDGDRWHLHRHKAQAELEAQRIELALRRGDGQVLHGQLDCLAIRPPDAEPCLRVTMADITQSRQADIDRQAALRVLASQEAERGRVSRQLHDDLGQRLSALKIDLGDLAPGPRSAVTVEAIVRALDQAVAMVRRMATDLRPLMLDDLGLSAAVDWLARESARQFGLDLTLRLAATEPHLDEVTAVTIYRVLQQALAHVAGQPGACGVVVELREEAGQLALTVRGELTHAVIPVPAAPRPEIWRTLREGAHLLGYQIEVGLTPEGAEAVTVRLPVTGAREAHAGWR